jgi:hypothetical protein
MAPCDLPRQNTASPVELPAIPTVRWALHPYATCAARPFDHKPIPTAAILYGKDVRPIAASLVR